MALRDLDEMGLLLPREHWGHTPSATRRTTLLTVFAALLGITSAGVIWFGRGGPWTLVGIGLFLLDLVIFLVVTFMAVDDRMARLEAIGADLMIPPDDA